MNVCQRALKKQGEEAQILGLTQSLALLPLPSKNKRIGSGQHFLKGVLWDQYDDRHFLW